MSEKDPLKDLNHLQRYLVEEYVEDYQERAMSRRQVLKYIAAVVGSFAVANTVLAGCAPMPAPAATTAAQPAAPTPAATTEAPAVSATPTPAQITATATQAVLATTGHRPHTDTSAGPGRGARARRRPGDRGRHRDLPGRWALGHRLPGKAEG